MKTTREILQCARNLVASGWTQGTYARVAAWNDADGRKQEEVVAAFDRAIELA